MSMKPKNTGQFIEEKMTAEEHAKIRAYYFGECGPHQNFYPKRHRWGPWQIHLIILTGVRYRNRVCEHCGVVSDAIYQDDEEAPHG